MEGTTRSSHESVPDRSWSATDDVPVASSHAGAVRRADGVALAILLPVFLAAIALVPPVFRRGEAREGLVVQSLVAGGGWIVPRREGVLASKPPLYHWIAAGAARVVGESDWTVRIPSALGAWTMVLATFVAGMALFDRRRAWLAVGTLLSMAGFWRPALEARVDMVFAATIAVALAGLASWRASGRTSGRAALYLGIAAAALTKGPAGVVLVSAIVVASHLREPRLLKDLWAPWPALASAALVAGWYGLAYRSAGAEFVAVQIVHENVSRAVGFGSFARQRQIHPLKLVGSFVTWCLPWNLTLVTGWRRPSTWTTRFLHAWWMVTLALFTIAAGKRGVYLLPLYPAIALLAADELDARLSDRRWLAPVLAGLALVGVVVGVGTLWSESSHSPLRPFVETVRASVPPGARVGVRGAVVENDRLVLAYRLHRAISRVPPDDPEPPFLVVPRGTQTTLAADCSPLATSASLVLVACPASGADERG
jgi:4-amino-4-deoxy-L-arabinose transferase-like glycosyltransferase